MTDRTGKHDSGKTSNSPRSGSGGKHSTREPLVVRTSQQQAAHIAEIRNATKK